MTSKKPTNADMLANLLEQQAQLFESIHAIAEAITDLSNKLDQQMPRHNRRGPVLPTGREVKLCSRDKFRVEEYVNTCHANGATHIEFERRGEFFCAIDTSV